MPINLTTLFTRVGQLGGALNALNTYRKTTLSNDLLTAIAETDGGSMLIRDTIVPGLLGALASGRNGLSTVASTLKAAAQALLIRTVHDDQPLHSLDLLSALLELKRQMSEQAYYIEPNGLGTGITVTQTNLDGQPVVAASIKDPEERELQNLLAQTLELRVTDVGTPGSETVEILGQDGPGDPLHWDWPQGSGSSRSVRCVDAALAGTNWITNGGFETWTGAALSNWSITTGAYGTDVVEETGTKYKGSKGIKLVGDGATLTTLEQTITTRVTRITPIAWNLFARHDGTPPAAGTLRIELVDGSDVVLTDESGVALQHDIDLTALTATFAPKLRSIATPRKLPAVVKVRLRLTVALTTGRSVFLDHFAVAPRAVPEIERAGWEPSVVIFSGNPDLSLNDKTHVTATGQQRIFRMAPANDRVSQWASLTDQFWDTSLYGVILPYSGTTLINDSLIT